MSVGLLAVTHEAKDVVDALVLPDVEVPGDEVLGVDDVPMPVEPPDEVGDCEVPRLDPVEPEERVVFAGDPPLLPQAAAAPTAAPPASSANAAPYALRFS